MFECEVDEIQFEALERELLSEIEVIEDNLRFYRITEPTEIRVRQHGTFRSVDFAGTLIA